MKAPPGGSSFSVSSSCRCTRMNRRPGPHCSSRQHGPCSQAPSRSQHLLQAHGFLPSSSASIESNCCPRPASSHTSDAASSLARNRCTSRLSVAAADLAGPTHGLIVGKVGRPRCTIRLLAGRRGRWRSTRFPYRSHIALQNQPTANATMIIVSLIIKQFDSDRTTLSSTREDE